MGIGIAGIGGTGIGGVAIGGSGVSGVISDLFFADTVFLMGGTGTNGGTDMIDESGNANIEPAFNGNAQVDTDQANAFSDGLGIVQMDGTTDWLYAGTSSHADLEVSNTRDGTWEAWIRMISLATDNTIFDLRDTNSAEEFSFYVTAAGKATFRTFIAGSADIDLGAGATTLVIDQWYHVAACRETQNWTLWVDGVVQGNQTEGGQPSANTSGMSIGRSQFVAAVATLDGYLDEMRVTKSVARYPSNVAFTPPTARFPRS